MPTNKKVTKVTDEVKTETAAASTKTFVPTAEAKAKAKSLRFLAIVLWVLAIGCEVFALYWLKTKDASAASFLWIIIAAIVVDAVLAIFGHFQWQHANRLDPASKKDKVRFFFQNQLGVFITILAFVPLIVLILLDKNLKGAQKPILAGVAGVALLVAGFLGIDFHPASVEEYAEQTAYVEELTGQNSVYWTKSGTKYHLYDDCYTINTDKTDEIFQGTVAQARELKNITELCKICEARWKKENAGLPDFKYFAYIQQGAYLFA